MAKQHLPWFVSRSLNVSFLKWSFMSTAKNTTSLLSLLSSPRICGRRWQTAQRFRPSMRRYLPTRFQGWSVQGWSPHKAVCDRVVGGHVSPIQWEAQTDVFVCVDALMFARILGLRVLLFVTLSQASSVKADIAVPSTQHAPSGLTHINTQKHTYIILLFPSACIYIFFYPPPSHI